MWHVGIDVGGTFTDLFASNGETTETTTAKVLTTPKDRTIGVMKALESANIKPADIRVLVHGTTTATNALVERSYPPIAMITTEGFRDVIEIGRQRRQHLFDLRQKRPEPMVSRRLRYTVACRLSAKGEDICSFDVAEARSVARKIKSLAIKSVAICFINSYVDSRHETQMRDILLAEHPDCHVALSSETVKKFREHGRFSTTVIRAALLPVMTRYFDRLTSELKSNGFVGSLLAIKSNGGMMGVDLAIERPEELVESGPAGGVAYARYLSRTTDFSNIIHTDMGGTTFDASIVDQGEGLITHDYQLEWEIPIAIPMLDIRSVGAGGGSIAWIDSGGSLRVGPQSTGSDPGPACYGRGGEAATVTDANFVLGRLDETLGGKLALDAEASKRAVAKIGQQLGLDPLAAAEAIILITCENMAQAIKLLLTDRGRDPRDFVLSSSGGAGPMHACFIARAMNIPRIIVPSHAGVASACGAISMDIRHDLDAFYYAPLAAADYDQLNQLYSSLESQGRDLLSLDGIAEDRITISRHAQIRYIGQLWEILTPIGEGELSAAGSRDISDAFHAAHDAEHGVKSPTFPVELVSIGLTASGEFMRPFSSAAPSGAVGQSKVGTRPVYFSGTWREVAIYAGEVLEAGATITGPAIVDYPHSETVLPPDTHATIGTDRNLMITLDEIS